MTQQMNALLQVRVPEEIRERLNRVAKEKMCSPSDVQRFALVEYLEEAEQKLGITEAIDA